MKFTLSLVVLFCFFSCSKKNTNEIDISKLNGYWEIDFVIANDGTRKDFSFNQYVDFFSTTGNAGFRSKVKPNLMGTYTSNREKLIYKLEPKNDTVFVNYTTNYGNFTDRLFQANSEQLGFKSTNGNLNYYRPFTPIDLNEKE